jgi:type 2A phosphatase activator TIP41
MSGAALCQKEVERLHQFFVDWFTGKLEQTPEHLEEHCTGRFSDDFCMVNPLGRLLSKTQLVTGLTHAYNSHLDGNVFEIHIHNCQVLQNLPSGAAEAGQLKLVSYEEWQRTGTKITARRSTALLHFLVNDKIEWKYVHETWLEGKGPNDTNVEMVAEAAAATDGRPTKPSVATLVSPRRHVSENLAGAKPISKQGELVGLDFRGISLQTTQGPMANEVWLDDSTKRLEEVCQSTSEERKRRLNLPEVCFSQATVEVKLPNVKLAWNVFDALHEWSAAHASIPVGSDTVCRGVSVLKSVDAALWSNKAVQTDFHYDWTYSSPFSVTTTSDDTVTWKPLPASGMNIDLLKDTTQPILYYDEIELYDDDLHDNGAVNFRVKLRLMPTCLYVLSRCWVRVDALLLQCHETRLMVEFAESSKHTVYRDITWRQCAWSDLPGYNLPTDVRVWKNEGTTETPAWNALVNRLPILSDLPEGLHKHSVLEVSSTKDDASMGES